ncbi:MAG: ABC transporter permease [Lachnospiraceae bacterium]|nr:ABC transporter permease [Lachnospiraceae bacterium]
MLRESIKMSWENIIQNKLRSFLTILGIIIGVTAIIALITVVQALITNINEQFDSVGANTLVINAQGTPLKQGLSDKDLMEINEIDGVTGIAPSINTTIDIYREGTVYEDIVVDGKNETFFNRNSDLILIGRGLNILDVNGKNRVCVISADFMNKVFMGENPVGQDISIMGSSYRIVGVADGGDDSVMTLMSGSTSDIYIPYKNLMSLTGQNRIYSLEVYMTDEAEDTTYISDAVEQYLDTLYNYKDNSYMLIIMDSLLDMMKDVQSMLTTALTAIASIALLVGGIGIMNMMLVSVTERTVEIGLRKALGAEPRLIQVQFLTEAIMLSVLGGILGIVVGLTISFICGAVMDIRVPISWGAIALGVGFSAAVGIIFGFAPAKKASELNPIDALRSV